MSYFHNHEYRHLLRSAGQYREWKKLKKAPSEKWWAEKYEEIRQMMWRCGLKEDGFSVEHTSVIERVLGFKRGELVKAYHGG